MIIDTNQVILPSDETNREIIRKAIQEMIDSKIRVQAEKDLQKDIAENVAEQTQLKKSHFNKMAKAKFDDKLKQQVDELSEIEASLDILYAAKNNDVGSDAEDDYI